MNEFNSTFTPLNLIPNDFNSTMTVLQNLLNTLTTCCAANQANFNGTFTAINAGFNATFTALM